MLVSNTKLIITVFITVFKPPAWLSYSNRICWGQALTALSWLVLLLHDVGGWNVVEEHFARPTACHYWPERKTIERNGPVELNCSPSATPLYIYRIVQCFCLRIIEPKLHQTPTFNSLHSRESEKAGNISSYFCTASWVTKRMNIRTAARVTLAVHGQKFCVNGLLLHSACQRRSDRALPWRSDPWHCISGAYCPLRGFQPKTKKVQVTFVSLLQLLKRPITHWDEGCWWALSHLFIDLNRFWVLLQLSCVGGHLQKALVCWTAKGKIEKLLSLQRIHTNQGSKTAK